MTYWNDQNCFCLVRKLKKAHRFTSKKMQNTQMKYPIAKIPGVDKLSSWPQMCLPYKNIYFSRMKRKKNKPKKKPAQNIKGLLSKIFMGLF